MICQNYPLTSSPFTYLLQYKMFIKPIYPHDTLSHYTLCLSNQLFHKGLFPTLFPRNLLNLFSMCTLHGFKLLLAQILLHYIPIRESYFTFTDPYLPLYFQFSFLTYLYCSFTVPFMFVHCSS